ncbi:hypothetical protein AB0L40_20675 [Patulibacter sp. NPDC049589]|uniref:hypothetical protein n=1 Tax=Patulibacter sp. NPDC049589 TaxID=3154731 RepID=UPI0034358401
MHLIKTFALLVACSLAAVGGAGCGDDDPGSSATRPAERAAQATGERGAPEAPTGGTADAPDDRADEVREAIRDYLTGLTEGNPGQICRRLAASERKKLPGTCEDFMGQQIGLVTDNDLFVKALRSMDVADVAFTDSGSATLSMTMTMEGRPRDFSLKAVEEHGTWRVLNGD